MLLRYKFVFVGILCVLLGGAGNMVNAFDGYILAGGHGAGTTLLLDENNDTIHLWDHSGLTCIKNGYSSYLTKDGILLRTAQTPGGESDVSTGAAPLQGVIDAVDANGTLLWSYALADKVHMLHHDFKILPNGNLLCVAFVKFTKDEAVAKGIDSTLFPKAPTRPNDTSRTGGFGKTQWGGPTNTDVVQLEKIIEVKPDMTGGNNHQIVWEWKIEDHIIPSDQASQHPEKFSGSLGPIWFNQWVHLNGMDYNPTKDLIVFTSRIFSEVFVIDHSTTTAEAATGSGGTHGKGGDILYRWGHADHYGATGSKTINTLHCSTWIPDGYENAGNIMFYHNNAVSEGYSFSKKGNSEVVEITPPYDAEGKFQFTAGSAFGPEAPTWIYAPNDADSIYSMSMSSAIRMKNGNTIVHEAFPPAVKDTSDTSRFTGGFGMATYGTSRIREVRPDGTLEGRPFSLEVNSAKIMYYEKDSPEITALFAKINSGKQQGKSIRTSIGIPSVSIHANTVEIHNAEGATISFFTLCGKRVAMVKSSVPTCSISTGKLSTGSYLVKVRGATGHVTTRTIHIL